MVLKYVICSSNVKVISTQEIKIALVCASNTQQKQDDNDKNN